MAKTSVCERNKKRQCLESKYRVRRDELKKSQEKPMRKVIFLGKPMRACRKCHVMRIVRAFEIVAVYADDPEASIDVLVCVVYACANMRC